jgi:hypothetical protein
MKVSERQLEDELIDKLEGLKYVYRADICDRYSLEQNFREKFEALNRVSLTDGEFPRLLEEIISADVFTAARTLRERNSFTRDDGMGLISRYSQQGPGKQKMSREQLIGLIQSDAKFMNEREDMAIR